MRGEYFGELDEKRLRIADDFAIFRTDGKYRSKIGILRMVRKLPEQRFEKGRSARLAQLRHQPRPALTKVKLSATLHHYVTANARSQSSGALCKLGTQPAVVHGA